MNYLHAWTDSLGAIAQRNRIVVDPAAWGWTTGPVRDGVDQGSAPSPRFWNTCQDVDLGQPRLDTGTAHYTYVDYKLFPSSTQCEQQWEWLYNWHHTSSHERVLHIVNDGWDNNSCIAYSLFVQNFSQLSAREGVHIDCAVRMNSWQEQLDSVHTATSIFSTVATQSFTITCIVDGVARIHTIRHPHYPSDHVIEKSY